MSAYSFVDTTEAPQAIGRPAEAVCFNGVWLDDEIEGFRTLNVSGREVLDKDIDVKDTKSEYGETFQRANYPPRTISVTYQLITKSDAEFREQYNKLNGLLSENQAKLVFADEPDKYFVATKSGNDEVDEGLNSVKGIIKFYCPNPLKYSTVLKEFTASENSDGILEATIVNNGTVEVPISYEITHSADNGYIGIVSENGAMQYGSVEEADGETATFTERLATISDFISASDDHGTCYLEPNADTSGSLTTTSSAGSTWLGLGSSSGTWWNGGMRTITIPADSSGVSGSRDFQVGMHRWFQKNHYTEIGMQIINIMGDSNTQIAGIKVYSTVETYENSVAEFWANGRMYSRKLFRAGQNIWSAGSKDGSYNPYRYDIGTDLIRKEGQKITFYYDSRLMSFNVPELAEVKATRMQVAFFRAKALPAMTANYYKMIDFNKLNVEKWIDNPNRYGAGDVVKIDGDARKIYTNNIPTQGDEVRGTTYFNAPVGESKVEFMCSSWVTAKPTVKAYIREAYL